MLKNAFRLSRKSEMVLVVLSFFWVRISQRQRIAMYGNIISRKDWSHIYTVGMEIEAH